MTITGNSVGNVALVEQDLGEAYISQHVGLIRFNEPAAASSIRPEAALEELLVNALIHRDYFTSATIRILVFADRVEIASPGHLPDSLSVQAIRQGRTNRRNPTLTEHAAQMLPYRGLGTGIPRALREWPQIELIDDVAGNQFSAVARRPAAEWRTSGDPVRVPGAGVTAEVIDPVSDPVADPVAYPVDQLLQLLSAEPLPPSALMAGLGLKHRHTFRINYLRPALERQWIAPTLPDKPNSRLQRYRLTVSGQARLQAHADQKGTP